MRFGWLGIAAAVCALTLGAAVSQSQSPARRPSFVLVIADDLDLASVEHLPGLLDRIANQGVTFSNAFASQPLCCPSRVSMLRGQYTHNHGIVGNLDLEGSCYEAARDRGYEQSNVATWLQSAGYRTAMVGKYLNRYPGTRADRNPRAVPAGWDEFYSPLWTGNSKYSSTR